MQLILTQDVQDLGTAGDVVNVKSGFGANYLVPQGMAVLCTPRNKSRLEHETRAVEARIVRERKDAQDVSKKLTGTSVTLTRLVGDDDKIFGSVTTKDIAEALENDGIKVDRRQIMLEAPLKALGVYEVDVKLHRDVRAQIKVWVVAD